jgi:hypothetical protein
MVFNRRHKAILFITLVTTGCALLLGAELKEALGFMMLGAAVAWAIGSNAASKLYSGLKGSSSSVYSWIRLPLLLTLAGAMVGALLLYSRGNPVAVVALSCFAGIFAAPFTPLPTKRISLRVPIIILAGFLFFVAAISMIETDVISNHKYGERFGELTGTAFVAFLAGIFWLSKGWKLVVRGISLQSSPEAAAIIPNDKTRTWPQYISVFIGLGVFTLWLCLLSWSASGDWAYAPEKLPDQKNNNLLIQVGFAILLASWPYRSWKTILDRQSNSEARYLKWHKRVTAFAGMCFATLLGLAITFGVQNGNDRGITDQVTDVMKDFKTVAAKIGAIKQRDMETTGDYIQAFSEVEALLPEFESQVNKFKEIVQTLNKTDVSRGAINIQRFYKSHRPQIQKNTQEQIDVVEAILLVTKEEVETAREMGALPIRDQPDFWKKNFRPLLVKESTLREKALALDAEHKSLMN